MFGLFFCCVSVCLGRLLWGCLGGVLGKCLGMFGDVWGMFGWCLGVGLFEVRLGFVLGRFMEETPAGGGLRS